MSGYVRNCYVEGRHGEAEPLFIAARGTVTARLDGYAIIPMEKYDRFILIAEEWAAMKLRELTTA